jgi:hypothetical protein
MTQRPKIDFQTVRDYYIISADVSTLLLLFTSDAFAREYQTLLANELVGITHFNIDDQIRNVEVLKEKLGELEMSHSAVMLKDVTDSRRIASQYSSIHDIVIRTSNLVSISFNCI